MIKSAVLLETKLRTASKSLKRQLPSCGFCGILDLPQMSWLSWKENVL